MISKSVNVRIPNEDDRNAALLVQTASSYNSRIHVTFMNKTVNAKSIMGVMTLPLEDGDNVTIQAEGNDEEKAVIALARFFQG